MILNKRGETASPFEGLLGHVFAGDGIAAEHELLYKGIRVLPPRIKEMEVPRPIPFSESVVAWAEIFTARVDLFGNPLPSLSQVRVRHLLDRFKSALTIYHQNITELRNRQFLREQELEAVQRNRAYRGFDYSPQIKNALSSIEGEMRQTKVGAGNVLQDMLFRILIERERVVGSQLPTEDNSVLAHHGIALRRLET